MGKTSTRIFLGFLIAAHLFGLARCSEKSTPADTTPPEVPVLLPAPEDSSWDEAGIDAVPEEDWIQLVWLASSDADVRGYKIFRGLFPDEILTHLGTKILGTGDSDTTYLDQSVEIGVRYNYQVTAYDGAGNESAMSDTVDYMLIPKLSTENLISPRGEITERRPTFSWMSTGESLENRLRVYDVLEARIIWVSPAENPFASPHAVVYNKNGTAVDSLLAPGREYWWRVDRQGTELRSGSESNWVSFSVR